MKKQTLTDKRLSKFDQPFKREAQLFNGKVRELEEIVNDRAVSWDFWPEYHIDRDERLIQIGFEFCLIGARIDAHEHSECVVESGSPLCITVYEDLQRIAEWVAPKERAKGSYEIVIADTYPYYSSHRRSRPEVLLIIRVINREGFEGSVDPSEVKCLMAMQRRAKELGIPRHVGSFLGTELSTGIH